MKIKRTRLKSTSINPKSGQGLVEYVALTALIAIVSIGTVKTFGSKVQKRLMQITTSFDNNIQQGLKSRHTLRGNAKKQGATRAEELPPLNGIQVLGLTQDDQD